VEMNKLINPHASSQQEHNGDKVEDRQLKASTSGIQSRRTTTQAAGEVIGEWSSFLMDKPCRGALPTVKNGEVHSTFRPKAGQRG
jgi:hypothetical protein